MNEVSMTSKIELFGLKLPEVKPGDDLAKMILESAAQTLGGLEEGDVLIGTIKVISKADWCLVDLNSVKPSKRANTTHLSLLSSPHWNKPDARH